AELEQHETTIKRVSIATAWARVDESFKSMNTQMIALTKMVDRFVLVARCVRDQNGVPATHIKAREHGHWTVNSPDDTGAPLMTFESRREALACFHEVADAYLASLAKSVPQPSDGAPAAHHDMPDAFPPDPPTTQAGEDDDIV